MRSIGKFFIAAVLALSVAACDWQTFKTTAAADIAAAEAKVAAWVATFRQKIPVAIADAKNAANLACSLLPVARSVSSSIVANVSGISASVQNNLAKADQYATKGEQACASYTATQNANVTPSDAVNTTLAAWNAYVAAKGQLDAAKTNIAAGK